MTSLTYFNQEKRKIQEEINSVVDQLNALKKVNVEDAESVQTLIEDITYASKRLEEEQAKFRALVFEHYSPAPDPDPEEDDIVYEEPEPQPDPDQEFVEAQAQHAQQAFLQNVISAVTSAIGAYGVYKTMKK